MRFNFSLVGCSFLLVLMMSACSSSRTQRKPDVLLRETETISVSALPAIEDISVSESVGVTEVIVVTDGPPVYFETRRRHPERLLIDLPGMTLGSFRETIEVNKGALIRIHPTEWESPKQVARLEMFLSDPVKAAITSEDQRLIISIEKPEEPLEMSSKKVPHRGAKQQHPGLPLRPEDKGSGEIPRDRLETEAVIQSAKPPSPADTGPLQNVSLNFDNGDIYELIKTIAEMLDINYIIDPAVKGTVNIHTRGMISRQGLFDIFASILKVNGATVVKKGTLYHIIPIHGASSELLIPKVEKVEGTPYFQDKIIFQVVHLDFISATEASTVLQPFVTPGAKITVFEKSNLLLITDYATNISKILKIIDILDVNLFTEVQIRLYPVKTADVQDVFEEMQAIFAALEIPSKSARDGGVHFIPISRINALLVISSVPLVFDEVKKWLSELDREAEIDAQRTFIYHVNNGIATELAEILNAVFAQGKKEQRTLQPERTSSEAVAETMPSKSPSGPTEKKGSSRLQGIPSGELKIVPYNTTNTIIVKTTLSIYKSILEVLKDLDVRQRQVLIDILVAEITLNDETSLGFESAFRGSGADVKSSLIGTSLGLSAPGVLAAGGLTSSIVDGDFQAVFNALASENRVAVLASPHIIASDGNEASIDIGDEVPLIASRIFVDQREEVTLERRSTGVILKVNPHINTTGLVTLNVSLELSDAAKAAVAGESDIRIFQRNAKTTMVVQDGQTIVIGGLINKTKEKVVTKVPFLGDIPILGFLFRFDKDAIKKTELVLVLTPHVIKNDQDAKEVTNDFTERMEDLREELLSMDVLSVM